jgi:hypothetical protein
LQKLWGKLLDFLIKKLIKKHFEKNLQEAPMARIPCINLAFLLNGD